MRFLERKVVETQTDPIPPLFRACRGHVFLNPREIAAIGRNAKEDAETIKTVVRDALAENPKDFRKPPQIKPRKVTRLTPRLSPGNRMAVLRAVNPGRAFISSREGFIAKGSGEQAPCRTDKSYQSVAGYKHGPEKNPIGG